MSTSANAAYILERTQVREFPGVHVLGCHAPRLTVLSQQFRAFNLIWALFDKGQLRPGRKVGVIGGGIGGLTVAAAAMLKGCPVVLTEQHQRLMHIQRGCSRRLLHPNIYEWPNEGSEETSTRFPAMNWKADFADQVVRRLDLEWEALKERYDPQVHINTPVTDVSIESDGRLILLNEKESVSESCDVVIVAVGFGVEPPVSGINQFTYWENDSLEQSPRTLPVKSVFVSGTGDGGCIDILRLKYSDFNHTKFADTVSRHRGLEKYKKRLLEIENNLPSECAGEYLLEEYKNLNLPEDFAESFGTIRTDTDVVLNGNRESPLSPNACILHRLAVWSLITAGKVKYQSGKIAPCKIEQKSAASGIQFYVPIKGLEDKWFDILVLRHGPASCLTILPAIHKGYRGIRETASKDMTRNQLYPEGFYPIRSLLPVSDQLDYTGNIYSDPMPLSSMKNIDSANKMSLNTSTNMDRMTHVISSQSNSESAMNLANIEKLTLRLIADTKAENYIQAAEGANALEASLTGENLTIPAATWEQGHKALFDFEVYSRKRVESGGGKYDLNRMQTLVRRARRGTK